ncbi:MAG TPA: gamma-glutamyl-gamma-aminobutyrate hydrolase family protein [Anaerolineaceae bacterium]|nr:gamma-glutamyl-gamma-aminobutyrate hydrolase family protein [Anaerolineaceae bacterium]
MPKPVIIVAGQLEKHSNTSPIYGAKQAYLQAIIRAGGLPLVVAPDLSTEDLPALIGLCDGFLLCGGGDVEPSRYGTASCGRLSGVDQPRDQFEIDLIQALMPANKPMLAICRGVQVLNVALGGTLICDIATDLPRAAKHDYFPGYKRDLVVHEVDIQPKTLLAKALGATKTGTNSIHHQALDKLGEGLLVSARAADGLIEGVEMPSKHFVLGVQWHPECMPESPQMRQLFGAFIAACRGMD